MKRLTMLSAIIIGTMSLQGFAETAQNPVFPNATSLVKVPGLPANMQPGQLQSVPGQPAAQPGQTPQQQYSSDIDKLSYSVGVQLGQGLKLRGMNINLDIMIQGLKDGYNGQKLQMNDQDIRNTLVNYQKKMTAEMTDKFNNQKDSNIQASNDFLAKNKTQPGIVTTPSGLQYQVVKNGTGPQPTDKDVIVVNYSGTTIDGKEFDSSYKRGEPMTVQLKYMIPGWIEALRLMKTGSVWNLYIPANLAYGERGAPPVIGPNQALIFKVELLEVKKS